MSDNEDEYAGRLAEYDYESEEEEDELSFSNQGEQFTRLLSLTDYSSSHNQTFEEEEEEEEDVSDRLHRPVSASGRPNTPRKRQRRRSNKRTGSDSSNQSSPQARVHAPVQLEPVGLFWDIENCPVPVDKSAFALANKMRKEFFVGKREAEFMCVCDITKERKDVVEDLSKAHVSEPL